MRRRFTTWGLVVSGTIFVVLALVWLVLNHFRREYYNSAVEGPSAGTGPYFPIVHAQAVLVWPIVGFLGLTALMLLFEVVHYAVSKLSKN